MNAMEKMVANMLGISPEGLAAMITDAQTLATSLAGKLDGIGTAITDLATSQGAILETQREILARMEKAENERRNDSPRKPARKPAGSGDDHSGGGKPAGSDDGSGGGE